MQLFWKFLKASEPFDDGFPTFFILFSFPLSPEEAVYFDRKNGFHGMMNKFKKKYKTVLMI